MFFEAKSLWGGAGKIYMQILDTSLIKFTSSLKAKQGNQFRGHKEATFIAALIYERGI